jgi:hypothetical protein
MTDTLDRMALHVILNRFPVKHAWDTLALAQIFVRRNYSLGEQVLSFNQKLQCLRFYFDGNGIDNLYATLTRSGSHWTQLGIALAIDLAGGGDGAYYFENNLWYPENGLKYTKLDWRTPTGTLGHFREDNPFLFHTHHPYFRVRCARLKKMKIVIGLRNIHKSIESNYFKRAAIPDNPTEEDEKNLAWEKLVDDAIEFYNSWGDVIRWHKNCLVYKYEDLVADPVGTHEEMLNFWGFDLPRSCIEEAFKRITKEEMKIKIPDDKITPQIRISFRSKDKFIPENRKKFIDKKIKEKLIFNFGYDYG